MIITTTVKKVFERVCIDNVGLLPKTQEGNMYILTFQKELTRYALVVALATTDA